MKTFTAPRFRLGWMLFVVGFVLSLAAVAQRWRFEGSLRDVQLTVDYEDTRSISDAYQIPHLQLLRKLRAVGISSVGVYNTTLSNLVGNGRLTVTSRDEAEVLFPGVNWAQYPPAYRFLVTAPPQNEALLQQVKTHLEGQDQPSLPVRAVALPANPASATLPGTSVAPRSEDRPGLLISSSQQLRGDAQVGFDPAAIAVVKAAEMVPTARVSNALNLNAQRLEKLLDECQAIGARVVIFSEDEVLGYDTLQPLATEMMRKRELLFGNIEFTKQRGWPEFAERMEGQVVRVHSVGPDEAAKVKSHLLVDRYVRAVKERDVRVAYIRLVRQFKGEIDPLSRAPIANMDAIDQNLAFVASVAREIKGAPFPSRMNMAPVKSAFTEGNAVPYPGGRGLRYATLLGAGLGALGAAWLLLNLFFDLSVGTKTFLLLLGLILVAGLASSNGAGAKLIGLLAGISVAPVAMLWGGLPRLWERIDEEKFADAYGAGDVHVPWSVAFGQGVRVLLATSAIVLAGAMFVVSAFNHWKYLSHTDEFLGEKATLLFPPLLIAIAFGGRVFPERVMQNADGTANAHGATQARAQAMRRLSDVMSQPFTFRVVATALALAFAGSLFLARTGNDSGMEISQLEWNFRSLMEQIFLTRPRTKEMFFGMPAMILGAYFALRKQPLLALGAAVAASVGIADALNTFCHFWTPLFYSVLRTVHAIWIGALVGGVALWLWMRLERQLFGRMKPVTLTPRARPSQPVAPSVAPVADGARTWNPASVAGGPRTGANGVGNGERAGEGTNGLGAASAREAGGAPGEERPGGRR